MADPARSALSHQLDLITGDVIKSAIAVHRALGPGLLESAYVTCLRRELAEIGREVRTEIPVPIVYRGEALDVAYRADMLVDDQVVVEVKSCRRIHEIHIAQTITYVTLLSKPVALLLNFNTPLLRDGIVRVLPRAPSSTAAHPP